MDIKSNCNNCMTDCRRKRMNVKGVQRSGMFSKGKFVMYADATHEEMQACNLHKRPLMFKVNANNERRV